MKQTKIGEICRVVSGATPGRDRKEYWGGDIPWVTPKEISSLKGIYLSDTVEKITQAGFKSCSTEMLPAGSLLLSSRAPIGLLAINKIPVCTNQGFKSLVPSKKVDVLFLYYNLKHHIKHLQAKGRGATFKELSKAVVEELRIPTLPINDQIRVAKLLNCVDSMIAKRKKGLSLLDELLKGIFFEMFGDPVRNDRGWNTTPFSKIGDFSSGGTPSKKRKDYWTGSFPWVSPKDMKVAFISDAKDHIAEKVFEETSLKRIDPGHLLVVVRGMILAHSFPVAINTVPVAINQDMKAICPNPNYNVHYLMTCLHAMKRQVLALISSAGHGTRRFDALAMNKILVPSPPIDLQKKFKLTVEKIEALKSLYNKSLNELENLYGALSGKAFKGELDLSRIHLDLEPRNTLTTRKEDSVYSVSSVVEKENGNSDEAIIISAHQ